MYRFLLCFRYLRTRYIALASIISVTLGVATLIVVNSVMAGFSAEMHDRLHGLASDILIECHTSGGMPDPDEQLRKINEVCGDQIAGSSVSVHVPAMLGIDFGGQLVTRHVNLVGIDPATYDKVSHFGRYLLHPENMDHATFDLRQKGYAPDRDNFPRSGWDYRRAKTLYERELKIERDRVAALAQPAVSENLPNTPSMSFGAPGVLSDRADGQVAEEFDPMIDQFPGLVLGISTCSVRYRDAENNVMDRFYCRPGDDVRMMFPGAADDIKVVNQKFTVVDMYESGMSEYDSTFAFCRLDQLQDFRGMVSPESGTRSVTTIQLKLAAGAELKRRSRCPSPPLPTRCLCLGYSNVA